MEGAEMNGSDVAFLGLVVGAALLGVAAALYRRAARTWEQRANAAAEVIIDLKKRLAAEERSASVWRGVAVESNVGLSGWCRVTTCAARSCPDVSTLCEHAAACGDRRG
jgi:hypothetical protein